MNISEKPTLRSHYLAIRKSISGEDRQKRSALLADAFQLGKTHHTILCFAALPDEISIDPIAGKLFADMEKTVVFPRVRSNRDLSLRIVKNWNDLEIGSFGIREPKISCPEIDPSTIDLVLVPGIAFTKKGERLGFGGGYYDQLLAKIPQAQKVGIAFREQKAENLPTDEWDIPMDQVIFC